MRAVKEITLTGAFTALLIGGQVALSAISGVEIITVLLLAFSFCFGARRGMISATAFSILRCFVFGFIPTAIILYLAYYNLFALVFGVIGRFFLRGINVKKHLCLIAAAVIMTALFTLFDDLITPLFYGYSVDSAKAYFYASLYAMIPQTVCSAVTTAVLLRPLLFILKSVKPE